MGDGDHAAFELNEQVFQPFNGVQVQVVGWLVQQQNVRLRYQSLGQSHAFFGSAGEGAHHGLGVQVQAVQGFAHTLFPVPAVQ